MFLGTVVYALINSVILALMAIGFNLTFGISGVARLRRLAHPHRIQHVVAGFSGGHRVVRMAGHHVATQAELRS